MTQPSLSCDEFLDLATPVVLDVAEPSDLERVERHAAECPACAADLNRFRETAALLGLRVPQVEPPAALRQRVLDAARREPRPILRGVFPRRGRLSPAWLVAAASFLISLGALAWVAVLQGQVQDLQRTAMAANDRAARYERAVQVLRSDALAVRPLRPMLQNTSSTGMVFLDPSSGTGMLMCRDLPPIEQGHAYQVWFVRGTERVSGGMLWPDHSGSGYAFIQVPSDLQSFDSIGITDEPGSGSKWPTTPGVMGSPIKESSQ